MNKYRRRELYAIQKKLSSIINIEKETVDIDNITSELEDIVNDLDYLYDEESTYMDNIPENLQYSSVYEKAEKACDNLENASDWIYCAISSDDFDCIVDALKSANSYIDDATL